jgi:hypothetical protein
VTENVKLPSEIADMSDYGDTLEKVDPGELSGFVKLR